MLSLVVGGRREKTSVTLCNTINQKPLRQDDMKS